MLLLKKLYVRAMRFGAAVADLTGFRRKLEKRLTNRKAHWMLSLLAIYDLDDMIRLDVPWWTYGAIDEVEKFLAERPGAKVFEYGSGASSVWLARRGHLVTSVEHDEGWFLAIEEKLRAYISAQVVLKEPQLRMESSIYQSSRPGCRGKCFKDYVSAIDETGGMFDLIIIDGRARVGGLAHAVNRLKKGGLIVLDNSARRSYQQAIRYSGARVRRFRGLVPTLPYPGETSLLDFDDIVQ